MDPNQPYQPGQLPSVPKDGDLHPGQYDFITNPVKPQRRGLKGLGGGGKSNMLMLIGGGLLLLTLIITAFSLLSGGSSNKDVLLRVARQQSQLIEIAEEGASNGSTNQAQSLALAVQLTVTTQQNGVIEQLQKDGKVKPKDYQSAPSSEVTQKLEAGQRNGRFDEAFNSVMGQALSDYQDVLKQANATASGSKTKDLLANDFNNVSLLLKIPQ